MCEELFQAKGRWCKACLRRGKIHESSCVEIVTCDQETQTDFEEPRSSSCDNCYDFERKNHDLERKLAGMTRLIKQMGKHYDDLGRAKERQANAYQTAQDILVARLTESERLLQSERAQLEKELAVVKVKPTTDAETQTDEVEQRTVVKAVSHPASTQTEFEEATPAMAEPQKQKKKKRKKKRKGGSSHMRKYKPAETPMSENKVFPLIYGRYSQSPRTITTIIHLHCSRHHHLLLLLRLLLRRRHRRRHPRRNPPPPPPQTKKQTKHQQHTTGKKKSLHIK
jgi:hypothetical protein